MNDEQLATAASKGDRQALEQLTARHQRAIRRWALIGLGRTEAADDATQEVLLRLVRSIRTFNPAYPFLPWLRTIVRNAVTDHHRIEGRSLLFSSREPRVSEAPEARLDARRALSRAHDAFATLTPRQREAYLLCEIQGLRATEAATQMEVEAGTVRALLHQARRVIRASALSTGGQP